ARQFQQGNLMQGKTKLCKAIQGKSIPGKNGKAIPGKAREGDAIPSRTISGEVMQG
ncbi:hypothetical protein P7K49_032086, partial [Saguinus oedipus]